MKRLTIALSILIVVSALVYLWPVPSRDFAELADRVDPQVRQSLLDFRARYPLQTVHVDGEEWEYVAVGEGPETVLFLHGMTGAYDIWWQQMLALSGQYRLISLTYPPVDTLEGMSRGVMAVLDAEGVEQAGVVGTSLGGYLLQYLMATRPDRISCAVLANTFPPNDLLAQRNRALIQLLPFLPSWVVMKFLRDSFVDKIYPAAGHSELVLAYMLEQAAGRMDKAQVVARARAVIEPFVPPDPGVLAIPTLIIEADNDPLVEAALRAQLKATYPSARVHTLPGAGHFPYLNEAAVYTRLLEDFFEQCGPW